MVYIFSVVLHKDLVGKCPLCIIISNSQGKMHPREVWVPGGHVALLRGKTTVLGSAHSTACASEIQAALRTTVTVPLRTSNSRTPKGRHSEINLDRNIFLSSKATTKARTPVNQQGDARLLLALYCSD